MTKQQLVACGAEISASPVFLLFNWGGNDLEGGIQGLLCFEKNSSVHRVAHL